MDKDLIKGCKEDIVSFIEDRCFLNSVSLYIKPQVSDLDITEATLLIKDDLLIKEFFKDKELSFINNSSYFSNEEIKKMFFFLKKDFNRFHYYLFSLFLYKLENRSIMESDIELNIELNINEFCNEFNELNLGINIEFIDLERKLIKFKKFNLLEV